jgi:hypothetical protein
MAVRTHPFSTRYHPQVQEVVDGDAFRQNHFDDGPSCVIWTPTRFGFESKVLDGFFNEKVALLRTRLIQVQGVRSEQKIKEEKMRRS